MRIDVLGAVRALRDDGSPVDLGGPRHREVLARLVAAEGRMVTTDTLVDDLWADPPARAVGALRTFVAALRRALEPDRPPRDPPRIIVTEGPGYALRLPREDVDVHRFQDTLARARRNPDAAGDLGTVLADWRGPAYADVTGSPWAQRERTRLEELRLEGTELRARILLDSGEGAELVAGLGAHVAEHPWREPAWELLARALHRAGRRADALATLRRARTMLVDQLGLDPGPDLQRLEKDILNGAGPPEDARTVWTGPGVRLGPRTTVDLARTLALAGGDALVRSRRDRLAAVRAAERTGDLALTARIIAAYDVPAVWSRADDPEQSRAVVAAAERTLTGLGPDGPDDLRARLLATVAVESRSADLSATELKRAQQAACQAEELARDLADPALLAFALNGVFLQSFTRPGLAEERDRTGAEILDLATRHELPNFAVLGRLVRLQSASALGDLDAAATHAEAAEQLSAATEAPLVSVLTCWFRARATAARSTEPGGPTAATAAAHYRAAEGALRAAGMPGLHRGLFPLALLGLRLLHDRPAPTEPHLDWGPYRPWTEPLVLLAQGRGEQARAALAAVPESPRDHMQEAMWCLTARAAVRLDERGIAAHAGAALRHARAEHAGAASGMLTLGPVARYLAEAEACARAG
ncbi:MULTISPECIES: AfsR/SARP family transcriptional regulator [Streptomyces]|uniref:SARP family transcriptional regulator n=1 Tax=Streptomyces tsukubensis (strain DSM 42081 / NBRC 108919 / NRRL 18488 / 9993) TaxID=1114943 RepID=I2MXL7_STRT9|nr:MULTISPECIES: AfsR/SARP family transcriptional regulator [Streptomyces]AZK93884.1 SARP family transcriptional regulator [Streptomyces tsukubensis]EIF89514.1 SARP family transcriptional regulator [Streptomyces tsukubensis NRRL18488]MYS64232.1 SARP family transcriptional regulator [Streptomyces sp. SID5473]QKM69988.1 SARP family transcriptional regulator [Streptomyces tsukubensis NRRL18488]QWA14215.1 regulator [Streptomyces tsukubensis]